MNDGFRINMHNEYFQVCKDQVRTYESLSNKIELLSEDEKIEPHIRDMNITSMQEQQNRAALISVPFAAMCLEAFIFDYGATRISSNYYRTYLDKLDLASKWVVVPKLVTGTEIPRTSQAFEALKQLVSDRNKLVHFKSALVPVAQMDRMYEVVMEHYAFLPKAMHNGKKAVELLMTELDKIHRDTSFMGEMTTETPCHA